MRLYGYTITQMTLDGLIDGAGFGALYGLIVFFPGGLFYGALFGAIVGTVLGIPSGLIVGFITHHYLYRRDDPVGYRYGLSIGIAVFVMVGAGLAFSPYIASGMLLGILLGVIPTLIASICAGYAAKKLADQYVDEKRESHV